MKTINRNVPGEYFRMVRELENITQLELANAAKISPATLRNIEKGKAIPHHETLEKLIKALNDNSKSGTLYTVETIGTAEGEEKIIMPISEIGLVAKNMELLNDEGRKKVIDYSQDLTENPKYTKGSGNE